MFSIVPEKGLLHDLVPNPFHRSSSLSANALLLVPTILVCPHLHLHQQPHVSYWYLYPEPPHVRKHVCVHVHNCTDTYIPVYIVTIEPVCVYWCFYSVIPPRRRRHSQCLADNRSSASTCQVENKPPTCQTRWDLVYSFCAQVTQLGFNLIVSCLHQGHCHFLQRCYMRMKGGTGRKGGPPSQPRESPKSRLITVFLLLAR